MQPDNEMLAEVLTETLEQFALLFCDPADGGEIPPSETPYRAAAIKFRAGPRAGDFSVAASSALCREMAANILGLDLDDVADEAMTDAVKELANVLLGDVAVRCFGTETVCEMETPEARSLDRAAVVAMAADPDALCMRVDDEFLLSRFRVQ